MSDFLWYTRLLVWVGCGGLLIQSVTGRSVGFVTLVCVIFLTAGFMAFVGGLALESRSLSWLSALPYVPDVPEPTSDLTVKAHSEGASQVESSGTAQAQITHSERQRVQPEEAPIEPALQPPTGTASVASTPAARAEPARSSSVVTEELGPTSTLRGYACPRCTGPFQTGQLAVTCWSCGTGHHASCWIENRFHCARAGCDGAGNLEAPRPVAESSPRKDL